MKTESETSPDSFRDHIATVDKQGQRLWLYPTKPSGKLYNARQLVAFFLLAFFFITPLLKINGEPIILFDILSRHFILFGVGFRPHDMHIVVLIIITAVVFLILFTAVLGRLFCGWICPQTIFVEMVYRRIEYLIDGSPVKQKRLSESPWTAEKIFKRLFKHSLFLGMSFIIANFVLAYFLSSDKVITFFTEPYNEHTTALTGILIFTATIHFTYGWFREQACVIVCPYGRLQGVLIDSDSIVVAYDHVRGEPRGKIVRKDTSNDKGDCVDCGACVRVCPTGIDIRNGTQLECVNCTACIDSCNEIMRKTKRPEGLIRYTSEDRIHGKKYRVSGRVILSALVTLLLTIIITIMVINRTDIETTLLRVPGTLYYEGEAGTIRNLYTIKCLNRTSKQLSPILKVVSHEEGQITIIQGSIELGPGGIVDATFFVDLPEEKLLGPATPIIIEISSEGKVVQEVRTSFMGPGIGGRR